MAAENVFATPETFRDYVADVQERLAARREEERRFLVDAIELLDAPLREAKLLGDTSLASELEDRIAAARRRLAELAPGTVGGVERPVETASEAARDAASLPGVASVTSLADGAGAAAARPVGKPGLQAMAPRPSSAPLPSASPLGASPPGPTFPLPARPLPRRAARTWTPRPTTEIDHEIEELEARLDIENGDGEPALLRLKAFSCRQRRAFWELEEQNAYAGGARALYGRLKARVIEQFGDRYVIPMNTGVAPPDPACWERLAQRYESLATAMEAFAWYGQTEAVLRPPEATSLLEAIGGVQQQLYREIDREFPGHLDEQQRRLYQSLLDVATERRVRLHSLHPERSDAELDGLASGLEDTWRRLREGQERKSHQTECVARLIELTAQARFGTHEGDPVALREVAVGCLEAGIPASSREIRDTLLPWIAFLEGEEPLAALVREIHKELDRRVDRDGPAEDEEPGGESLSLEIQELLAALLPYTRGKRCLFIGGDAREEKRRELKQALELEELIWPEARRTASVYDFEPEIARSDITVLIVRFMRTGFKQAMEFCRAYDKRLVRLPRGLGLTRVITDFHHQLVPRSGVELSAT